MTREEILDAARSCVCGDRDHDYGSPEDNFSTIGRFWSTYLKAARPDLDLPNDIISAKDVAAMMSLMKIARIASGTKPDSFVDLAGYAACGGEISSSQRD